MEFDIVVVGGGITGAGIALDAASRGFSVALLEKRDFGSGTSSASSKLIHGGFRYLKSRDFKLVSEALHERGLLLRLAPGMVKPLPFVIPVYGWGIRHVKEILYWIFDHEKTTMMKLIKAPLALRAAVFLYDILAGKAKIRTHEILSGEELLKVEPMLRKEGLRFGAIYWDAFGLDFRLVISVVKAAQKFGAKCMNYCEVVDVVEEGGRIVGIRAKMGSEVVEIRAKKVVFAVGPWADIVAKNLGVKAKLLKPSKGSHIVVPRSKLRINNAVVMEASDGRLVFAIPWDDVVIIGTTEIEFEDPETVAISREEVDYLLEVANRYFPEADLGYEDIISTYSGIRPLINAEAAVGDVTREHRIFEERGAIFIIGGKLTTYRVMAKDVVDRIAEELGGGECVTENIKLKEEFKAEGFDGEVKRHLEEYYGRDDYEKILEIVRKDERLASKIDPSLPFIWAEVDFAVKHEFAKTLEDVMVRRLGIYFRSGNFEIAEKIAARMAELLDWSEDEMKRQLNSYRAFVERNMRWKYEGV